MGGVSADNGSDAAALRQMLADIGEETRYTRELTGRNALNETVLAAMAAVPRHLFVSPGMTPFAYDNGPLPIGHGQTISQPFIVALMTDLLLPGPHLRVLEVGTGSGYQTAVLAQLVQRVFSIEIVPALASEAVQRLRELGIGNVELRQGDGYHGWPEQAPFDRIIVTAAAPTIPPALLEQLRPGGRMVIPLGEPFSSQDLCLVTKDASGHVEQRTVLPVAFVPLTRD